ncbi:hypothetical protein Tco_0924702 [Tanacetum coccineum]|uniref:Uncharacterized protein n=1 Tax=Tanacetum coccineum TaxID=301880 RepID=A0ABQ5D5K5_9ASTR
MKKDQAGSNPGKSYVALARPNPKPMHKDFMAAVYPKVHKSLKLLADEHVILEDPLSSYETLSLIKNMDDTYTFGDQFFNDKSTKDEPGKPNVDVEVISMVTVPIHQVDISVPPLSTLVIDISYPKPSPPPIHASFFTAITETTTTTVSLPPPSPTQSLTDPELAARVSTLEKKSVDLERVFTIQNKTTKNLASMIYILEHHDLHYKIYNYVCETVKENVQTVLRAPLVQSFRDMSEVEMKKILHQRMFESGSYKTHPEHVNLYEALDRSMARDNMDEFIIEHAKSRKRHRDDQDPPSPPPKESDQSKKKRQDSDASASRQPPIQTSSAWKTTDTRDTPSSSSKQKQASPSVLPVDDVSTPHDAHISDLEDTGAAHLPKIKTRPEWLKPVPEEERLETPEPD